MTGRTDFGHTLLGQSPVRSVRLFTLGGRRKAAVYQMVKLLSSLSTR